MKSVSRPVVAPEDQNDPVYRAQQGRRPTDWNDYRKCSQVCRAEMGQPCFALSGRIVDGQPDRVFTPLLFPHASRRRRARR